MLMNMSNWLILVLKLYIVCLMNTFQHEPDGVPLRLLKEELINEGITDHIPEPRLNNILTNADRNGDNRIDGDEYNTMAS